MVEKPAVALAQPIPEEEVLKIETEWPFENLERAFGEMIRQKLVETGAELLVPKRFLEFGRVEPVPPKTEYMVGYWERSRKARLRQGTFLESSMRWRRKGFHEQIPAPKLVALNPKDSE